MTAFLLATLYAPLASWGDITVGERRTSWDRPSRSAILGLVAGALGITREDQEAHDALDSGTGVAVRVDAPGRVVVDYHTAQTLPEAQVKRAEPGTRRDLIRHGQKRHRLQTILSGREYRIDAAYTMALWARDAAHWSLAEIAAALHRPQFVPYAGRKANALAWPMAPSIVEAATLAEALRGRPALDGGRLLAALRPAALPSVSCDDDLTIERGLPRQTERLERRRDAAPHRGRWQFAERRVITGVLPPNDEAGA